jgi:ElaB/YqjD/DUF883 family membrane-anchored ribosome-binding protein
MMNTNITPTSLSDGLAQDLKPLLNHATESADMYLKRGMQAVHNTSDQLMDQVNRANDVTVAYIRREPVKSVLWAAAAGAAVVGLISLFGRIRH